MDFRIIRVFDSNAHLVFQVEHYNADGSVWFTEHYTWQGREGLRRKRMVNRKGELLLSDQSIAPRDQDGRQYLPAGKKWRYRPGTHMGQESILDTIRTTHDQRLMSGWPQGSADELATALATPEDVDGITAMNRTFRGLVGYSE